MRSKLLETFSPGNQTHDCSSMSCTTKCTVLSSPQTALSIVACLARWEQQCVDCFPVVHALGPDHHKGNNQELGQLHEFPTLTTSVMLL